MTEMKYFLLVLLSSIFLQAVLALKINEETMTQCEGKKCPQGTYLCKKEMETTEDRKNVDITISCLDKNRKVLQSYQEQKPNPFEGGVLKFVSYSFCGVYTVERKEEDRKKTLDIAP